MPRAGPLCRGFGFQGGARIPAAPGNSRSQRGQSPPSPDPSLWPFAHGQSQPVSTGGAKGAVGQRGCGGQKPPHLSLPLLSQQRVPSLLSWRSDPALLCRGHRESQNPCPMELLSSRGSRFWDLPPPQPLLLADATGRTSSAFSPDVVFHKSDGKHSWTPAASVSPCAELSPAPLQGCKGSPDTEGRWAWMYIRR